MDTEDPSEHNQGDAGSSNVEPIDIPASDIEMQSVNDENDRGSPERPPTVRIQRGHVRDESLSNKLAVKATSPLEKSAMENLPEYEAGEEDVRSLRAAVYYLTNKACAVTKFRDRYNLSEADYQYPLEYHDTEDICSLDERHVNPYLQEFREIWSSVAVNDSNDRKELADDIPFVPESVVLTKRALKNYRDVCNFIYKKIDLLPASDDNPDFDLCMKAKQELNNIRSVDIRAVRRTHGGFINAFDTYVCALMFYTMPDEGEVLSDIEEETPPEGEELYSQLKAEEIADNAFLKRPRDGIGYTAGITGMVLLGIGILWALWHVTTQSTTTEALHQMGAEVHLRSQTAVQMLFAMPPILAKVAEVASRTGEFNLNEIDDFAGSNDQFLLETLYAHRVTAVIVGSNEGHFVASYRVSDEEYSIFFFNKWQHCFWEYYVDEEQNRRNSSRKSEACTEKVFTRPWWISAENYVSTLSPGDEIEGGWTNVYIYIDPVNTSPDVLLGITFYYPVLNNGTLQYVWAVDLELPYLNSLLTDIDIPKKGVVFIAEVESGNILASSTGEYDLENIALDIEEESSSISHASESPLIRATAEWFREQKGGVGFADVTLEKPLDPTMIDGGFLIAAVRLESTPGLQLIAVSVFGEDEYLSEQRSADYAAGVLTIIAAMCAVALGYLSYAIAPSSKQIRHAQREQERAAKASAARFGAFSKFKTSGRWSKSKSFIGRSFTRRRKNSAASRSEKDSGRDRKESGVSLSIPHKKRSGSKVMKKRQDTGLDFTVATDDERESDEEMSFREMFADDDDGDALDFVDMFPSRSRPQRGFSEDDGKDEIKMHESQAKLIDPDNAVTSTIRSTIRSTISEDGRTSPRSRTETGASVKFEKTAKEQLKAEDKKIETKNKRNEKFIYLLTSLLVMINGFVWMVWSYQAANVVTELTEGLIDETQVRVVDTVSGYLRYSQSANTLLLNRWERGDFFNASVFEPPADSDSQETYDRYFYGMLESLKGVDGEYLVEMVYAGFETGYLSGAQLRDDAGFVVIAALDNNTRHEGKLCYSKYNVTDNGVRDLDNLYWNHSGDYCQYDPRARPWYTAAVEKACAEGGDPYAMTWSSIYTFSDLSLGITATQVFYKEGADELDNCTAAVAGVFAVDLGLEFLSSFLRDVVDIQIFQSNGQSDEEEFEEFEETIITHLGETFSSHGTRTFIVEPDGTMIATSAGAISRSVVIKGTTTIDTILFANQSDDDIIRETAEFLLVKQKRGEFDFANVTEPTKIERQITQPLTWVSPFNQFGLNWIIIVTVPREGILAQVETDQTLSFLVGVGTLVLVVFGITQSYRTWKTASRQKRRRKEAIATTLGGVEINDRALQTLRIKIKSRITKACEMSWEEKKQRKYNDEFEGVPIENDAATNHVLERAKQHIQESTAGVNILTRCHLESKGSWPNKFYTIQKNKYYAFTIHLVVVLHICLAFFEQPSNEQLRHFGPTSLIVGLEVMFLMFESVDLAVRMTLDNRYKINNFLVEADRKLVNNIRLFLFCFVWFNWVLVLGAHWSLMYWIPARAFLLIFMNAKIRSAGWTFLRSIYQARDVFLLYFCLVITASAMGVVLFRTRVNAGVFESSFENYIRSMTTSFVFISTGENYTDVVYNAFLENPFYLLFFIILTLIGMFFILAMVTAFFEQGFTRMQKEELKKRKLFQRTGMVAAFTLLDLDDSGSVGREEFEEFMKYIRKDATKADINDLFDNMNKSDTGEDVEADSLDVIEFVEGVEEISVARLLTNSDDDFFSRNVVLTKIRVKILEKKWFEQMNLVVVISQIWLLSLYGTYENLQHLDIALGILLLFMTAEVALRVMCTGLRRYWNWAHFYEKGLFKMYALRFDLIVVGVSFLAFVISRGVAGGLAFNEKDDALRFVMTFPILRIFTQVKRTRHLLFTLFQVIPSFLAVFVVLLCVFYTFGIYGTSLYVGKFESDPNGIPAANFETLGQSLVTLFQLMVGEAWHEVMYTTMQVTSWAHCWFFIMFVLMISLLFTNLFIGLILSVFSAIIAHERKSPGKELNRKQLDKIIENL